jgi:hypothetical protein
MQLCSTPRGAIQLRDERKLGKGAIRATVAALGHTARVVLTPLKDIPDGAEKISAIVWDDLKPAVWAKALGCLAQFCRAKMSCALHLGPNTNIGSLLTEGAPVELIAAGDSGCLVLRLESAVNADPEPGQSQERRCPNGCEPSVLVCRTCPIGQRNGGMLRFASGARASRGENYHW